MLQSEIVALGLPKKCIFFSYHFIKLISKDLLRFKIISFLFKNVEKSKKMGIILRIINGLLN